MASTATVLRRSTNLAVTIWHLAIGLSYGVAGSVAAYFALIGLWWDGRWAPTAGLDAAILVTLAVVVAIVATSRRRVRARRSAAHRAIERRARVWLTVSAAVVPTVVATAVTAPGLAVFVVTGAGAAVLVAVGLSGLMARGVARLAGWLRGFAGRRRCAVRVASSAVVVGVAALTMGASAGPGLAPSPPRVEAGIVIDVKSADAAALRTLMSYWDRRSVMWSLPGTSGWWTSANALTATIDAERAQGVHTYDAEIALTWQAYGGDFRNHYMDDTEWWGLAWLDAYQWTHDARYLATARLDADYATSSMSAGSIPWAAPMIKNWSQRNGITNALYVELSARLATVTGVAAYRVQAQTVQSWLSRTLTRGDGLLGDHPGNWTAWSYVQGADVAGLVALGDQVDAGRLAHAAMTSSALNAGGIATDPCEPAAACRADGPAFKGAYVRGLATLGTQEVRSYLLRQATSMYRQDRMVGDFYGEGWAGPPDVANETRQQSAVDLLTAAMPR